MVKPPVIREKVSYKVWSAILFAIAIPVVVTGIKVWSGQETDHLRYVEKSEMIEYGKEQARLRVAMEHMKKDIEDIKGGQKETQKDIKEILRHMRNKK